MSAHTWWLMWFMAIAVAMMAFTVINPNIRRTKEVIVMWFGIIVYMLLTVR